jgi:hypothetical protein
MLAKKVEALGRQPESLEREIGTVWNTSDSESPNQRQDARQRLNELTDKLALLADWRDQLQTEINRSDLLYRSPRPCCTSCADRVGMPLPDRTRIAKPFKCAFNNSVSGDGKKA